MTNDKPRRNRIVLNREQIRELRSTLSQMPESWVNTVNSLELSEKSDKHLSMMLDFSTETEANNSGN